MSVAAFNPDHILSALFARLCRDAEFRSLVNSIDKGPRRVDGWKNPSCTVNLLTASVDPYTHLMRATAIVNIYMDDTKTGRADSAGLGIRAQRAAQLLHWAQDPRHPLGPIQHPAIVFKRCTVSEPLGPLRSDHGDEHFVSLRVSLVVQQKAE